MLSSITDNSYSNCFATLNQKNDSKKQLLVPSFVEVFYSFFLLFSTVVYIGILLKQNHLLSFSETIWDKLDCNCMWSAVLNARMKSDFFFITGPKKNLNSSLSLGQVALEFCLPCSKSQFSLLMTQQADDLFNPLLIGQVGVKNYLPRRRI